MKSLDLSNFKLTGIYEDPSSVNFDIQGLHKKRTVIKGELRRIDYYKEFVYSSNTYNDLYLTEYRDYTRDAIGIVQYRTMTVEWYREDETIGLVKEYPLKFYSQEEAIQEGIDRRNNMIAFAKTTLLNGLKDIYGEPTNQTYAFDLLLSVKTQMDYFSQGYTQPLRDAITGSTKPYLTQGIKDNIITELTF